MVVLPNPAGWRSWTVPVSGGVLAYHRTGGGRPALVLSHGLTDNGLCWSRLALALAAEFDVVMLDARGHGASSRIDPVQPFDAAEDIAKAIGALGLCAPVVMGHSVGARATAAYASAHPGGASKVVLEDPPFLPLASPAVADARRRRFREQVARFQRMSEAEIIAEGRATSPTWHDDDFPPGRLPSGRSIPLPCLPTVRPGRRRLRAFASRRCSSAATLRSAPSSRQTSPPRRHPSTGISAMSGSTAQDTTSAARTLKPISPRCAHSWPTELRSSADGLAAAPPSGWSKTDSEAQARPSRSSWAPDRGQSSTA
ncbi:alpha/beta fold hydrolase [Phenylobacterium sp. J367]|uniref:alpha/beta fold hydrolase n=1 Tax=Phenylobacterium sp. J367 TaxID=2898435 RepID=UPI002150F815|nr:alpha/beta hydrolase [Phenylobacterium sp. J367]MCR5879255.1 alpha/beta hydrolase [Phenylobacterium sp. J367]